MSMITAPDVTLLVISHNSQSERRVSPSWTIDQLKAKLEPVTGIPISSQRLTLRVTSDQEFDLQTAAGSTNLASYPLRYLAELHVGDARPLGLRDNFTDVSAVEKYEMPKGEYESRTDSVLAWKKAQKLGRFNPDAPSIEEQKIRAVEREVDERGITVGARCRLLPESDSRRGQVKYIGLVPEVPGLGPWVGVVLDEPTGKNDGTIQGVRYFQCIAKHGVLVRPERVEAGNFPALEDFSDEEF